MVFNLLQDQWQTQHPQSWSVLVISSLLWQHLDSPSSLWEKRISEVSHFKTCL